MKLRYTATLLSIAVLVTPAIASAAGACCGAPAAKADPKAGKLMPVSHKDAAWVAKARESYPIKTCVISGEELGSMGEAPEYVYRADGKPDRLVKFCCDGCQEDFLKSPEAALSKLNDASKSKKQDDKKGAGGHNHH